MKRFIDLRASEEDIFERFAWWETVTDRFEEHGGEMAWTLWSDFEAAYRGDDLERYRRLCPEWTLTPNAQVKRQAERSEDCPLEPVVGRDEELEPDDPTPWCLHCGTKAACDCGPIAEND